MECDPCFGEFAPFGMIKGWQQKYIEWRISENGVGQASSSWKLLKSPSKNPRLGLMNPNKS